MTKRYSILEAMADKSRKPDAAGYQPLDPIIVAEVMRAMKEKR